MTEFCEGVYQKSVRKEYYKAVLWESHCMKPFYEGVSEKSIMKEYAEGVS